MPDLEERLRAEVLRRAHTLEPSADLPDRIHVQVRRHRRRRQALAGSIYIGVAAALVLVVALAWSGRPDSNAVYTDDDPGTPRATVTTTPTTTAPATTTPTTSRASIDRSTPLSRSGVGPIVAGMTLRQAADVAGVVITPNPSSTPHGCIGASVEGADFGLLAERSIEDPMESVIRVVTFVVEGSTEEGVAIGDPVAELTAAYGAPTTTYDNWDGPGSQLLVFESGGFAYSALVGDGRIAVLEAGDPAWVGVGDPNDCQ